MTKSNKQHTKHSLGFQDKAKLKLLVWNLDSDSIEWLYKTVGNQYRTYEKKGFYK